MGKSGTASKIQQHGAEPAQPIVDLPMAADDVLKVEVACYIAEMSQEMSRMARASGHHLLSYFLDMATAEAKGAADKLPDTGLGASSLTQPSR